MTNASMGIDLLIFLVLSGLGFIAFWRALKRYRRKAKPLCVKCRYDLRETPGLVCPECGCTHASETEKLHGRVNKKWLWGGAVAWGLVGGVLLILTVQYVRNQRAGAQVAAFERQHEGSLFLANGPMDTAQNSSALIALSGMNQKELDSYLFEVYGHESLRYARLYAASLVLSPMHHWGRHVPYKGVNFASITEKAGEKGTDETARLMGLLPQLPRMDAIVSFGTTFPVDDRGLKSLVQVPGLMVIELMGARIQATPQTLEEVAGIKDLLVLKMNFDQPIDDSHLKALAKAPRVWRLAVKASPSTRLTPESLKGFTERQMLEFSLNAPLYVGEAKDPMAMLPTATNLMDLWLPDIQVEQLKRLGDLQNPPVLQLNFRENQILKDGDLDWIGAVFGRNARPRELTWLDLVAGPKMTARSIESLAGAMVHQQALANSLYSRVHLHEFPLDEAALKAIGGVPLNTLVLLRCKLDATGLKGLTGSQIQRLILKGTPFKPEDGQVLAGMPQLKYVGVDVLTDDVLQAMAGKQSVTVEYVKDEASEAWKSKFTYGLEKVEELSH